MKRAIILPMIIFLLLAFGCVKTDDIHVYGIFYVCGDVFINGGNDTVYRVNSDTDAYEKFCDGTIVCSDDENMCVLRDEELQVRSYEGEQLCTLNSFNYKAMDICDTIIAYSDDDGIYTIDLEDSTKAKVSNDRTEALCIDDTNIVYEYDKSEIRALDLNDNSVKTIFSGEYCCYFEIYEEKLLLSDYNKSQQLVVVDIKTGNIEQYVDIRSLLFAVGENEIFYIPYVEDAAGVANSKILSKPFAR